MPTNGFARAALEGKLSGATSDGTCGQVQLRKVKSGCELLALVSTPRLVLINVRIRGSVVAFMVGHALESSYWEKRSNSVVGGDESRCQPQ